MTFTDSLSDPLLLKNQVYINGQWLTPAEDQHYPVYNPANGELLTQVANAGQVETRDAINAANDALKAWGKKTAKQRAELLMRWYQLQQTHAEDLARIMTLEQGKILTESRLEVAYGASFVEWFAEEAKRAYGDIIPTNNNDRRLLTLKQPVGVVAAITPWNFPNAMITRKAAPALAAGCTIVIKPASETPLSALALAELADRAGIPAGVINVVSGTDSRAIGGELTSNPIVRKLSFTGSTPVGKLLLKQCADSVKKVSMELGGNAPIIVFNDADLDRAVDAAIASKFRNAGQTCICANRLLVQAGIYDEFSQKFTAKAQALNLGNGLDSTTKMGPIITAKAVSGIHSLVEEAVQQGAALLTGGQPVEGKGSFYPATVLTNVNTSMRVFNEEIFGPVAPIFKFDTEAEAIAMANDTEFGLASYFFTRDIGRIWRVSEAIEYGMVGVNEVGITSDIIPFGGIKESGLGREGSKYGLDDYTEIKYICMGGLEETDND